MIEVKGSKQFIKDYRRASPGLQHLAEQEFQVLLRRVDNHPQTWMQQVERVEGIADKSRVLELKCGGGPRLLVHNPGPLVLWRLGNHEITTEAQRGRLPVSTDWSDPPPLFQRGRRFRFLPPDSDEGLAVYGPELLREWTYWLAPEQMEVAEAIAASVEAAVCSGARVAHAIFGGPGTGKTTVLTWLLKELGTATNAGAQLAIRLDAPESVVNMLENSTGWRLRQLAEVDSPDVILVDDPASTHAIDELLSDYPNASVIAGFDPLQMVDSIRDEDLDRWAASTAVKSWWLSTCFRQKEVVGKAARHVSETIAKSSPFLAENKKARFSAERSGLTTRTNSVEFVNPAGIVKTFIDPSFQEWDAHVRFLLDRQRRGELWRHWAPLLLVRDPSADIPEEWVYRLDPISLHRISTDHLLRAKGLEYQHAIVILGEDLHHKLETGFQGSGQNGYARLRLFRIPYSRPKDSLATFVFPDLDETS